MISLVTGGSGFCGTYLVRRLLKENHEVRIVDILPPAVDIEDKVKYFKVKGIETNDIFNSKIFKNVDVMFHLAARLPMERLSLNDYRIVNVYGTKNLLDMCIKYKIPKIVHISSSAVYGAPESPITENDIRIPIENYGKSKYEAELLCDKYREKYDIDISMIRPRTIIGRERLGAFYLLFLSIKNNKPLYIIGDGKNKVQLTSVEDLVDLLILLLKKKNKNEDFNVGTNKFHNLDEDMSILINKAKSNSKIIYIPSLLGKSACRVLGNFLPIAGWHYKLVDKDFYFDISKSRKMLKWYPKLTNAEMLWRAYKWYLENPVRNIKSVHKSPVNSKILKMLVGT